MAFFWKSLATGLPVWFLQNPTKVKASQMCADDVLKPQQLIRCTARTGDPMNCNLPGTYDYDDIVHADHPSMAPTTFNLGDKPTKAAQVWSTLPDWVRARMAVIHHTTLTNNHSNHPKVLQVMGQALENDMMPSLYASKLASCFNSVQAIPVSAGASNALSHAGQPLPNFKPMGLKQLLGPSDNPLRELNSLRDQALG